MFIEHMCTFIYKYVFMFGQIGHGGSFEIMRLIWFNHILIRYTMLSHNGIQSTISNDNNSTLIDIIIHSRIQFPKYEILNDINRTLMESITSAREAWRAQIQTVFENNNHKSYNNIINLLNKHTSQMTQAYIYIYDYI